LYGNRSLAVTWPLVRHRAMLLKRRWDAFRMTGPAAAMDATFTYGAAVWPLLAGLSVVLWSKARAWRARPALAAARTP
jgi:hypothetical protein